MKLKTSAKKLLKNSRNELRETKIATKLLWEARRRDLTKEEKNVLKDQTMDMGRLVFLGAIFAIPGSGILIIFLIKGFEKFGFRILPSSFTLKQQNGNNNVHP